MPQYSSKLNVQLLAESLFQMGVNTVVISPGSRNGALTMQFVNDNRFYCHSVVDERSAAFVALGMAQQSHRPVVICCTSGSAAANYYPAVTEAFYQNIPLIVLTADRPATFTDLFDGQTIRQENLYQMHNYYSIQLSESEETETLTDNFLKIKDSVFASILNSGPVHINMPFSEPLYTTTDNKLIEFNKITVPERKEIEPDWSSLKKEYQQSKNVMILTGQHIQNEELNTLIAEISRFNNVIVLTESTSNIHHPEVISQIDAVLRNIDENILWEFKPDLLITLGQNVISKKIKQFLRTNRPSFHWHVDLYWHPDTYFSLTRKIHASPIDFLKVFLNQFNSVESSYKMQWLDIRDRNQILQTEFMENIPWSDLFVFRNIIRNYPENYIIHYSNSAVIRYSQIFLHSETNPVYCNRGTSGIDGSTSTAVGFAIKSDRSVIMVTGDISFFYDSNALWNNEIPNSFRIIIVNNGGGNIFRIIPGPDQSGALEKFFETKHDLTAEHLAKMFGFEYILADGKEVLAEIWKQFYSVSDRPKILEIDTKNAPNAETLRAFIEVK